MTILTDDYINTIFSIFHPGARPKMGEAQKKCSPHRVGERTFFGVTRHLGQQFGEGIALPLSTSRYSKFLAIFAWINTDTLHNKYNYNVTGWMGNLASAIP